MVLIEHPNTTALVGVPAFLAIGGSAGGPRNVNEVRNKGMDCRLRRIQAHYLAGSGLRVARFIPALHSSLPSDPTMT
jgi:hypothetical protein